MRVENQFRRWGRLISPLAARQHGVVARWQLIELGVSTSAIGRLLKAGHLHIVWPGVYAVGHRTLSREGRWMAAALSGGPGAALSHRAAAALHQIRADSLLEVTSPNQRRPRKGVVFHRSVLPFDEVTTEDGIPVTTIPRTILDLAAVLPRRQVEKAINEIEEKRLYDRLSLPKLLERYPRRRGTATIKAILADQRLGESVTRSDLEEAFLSFIAAVSLPPPRTNTWINVGARWFECDAVWREQRLIVELDSRRWHATPERFESDRVRDRILAAAGWRVIRVTWRELHRNRAALHADLLSLLAV